MPFGKEVGLGPGHIVLDGDPVGIQPPTAAPPHFRTTPIVAKRSTRLSNCCALVKIRQHLAKLWPRVGLFFDSQWRSKI